MKTVLLVDDDDSFHFLCRMVFKRSGEQVNLITAFDGIEALEILQSSEELPDLILLDINMPRMNGHEFLKEYSEIVSSEIPIIAMLTSSNQRRDRDNALKYPFVKDYILKPLQIEHIERLMTVCDLTRKKNREQQMETVSPAIVQSEASPPAAWCSANGLPGGSQEPSETARRF